MFIDCFKNNGVPYLRLVESRRVTTKNGKLTSVKFPILSIGPLSKFDDGQPDYLARLRQSFRGGNPIIDSLQPYVSKSDETISVSFRSGSSDCIIQYKIKSVLPESDNTNLNWSYGLPGSRLAKALSAWQADRLPGDYYRMLNAFSDDLNIIFQALGVSIPYKLFTRGDLRTLPSSVAVF